MLLGSEPIRQDVPLTLTAFPPMVFTSIVANKSSLAPTGGYVNITVNGSYLSQELYIKAFDADGNAVPGAYDTAMGSTAGGNSCTGTLNLPNNYTNAAKVYTIKVSKDNQTWETSPTTTVIVRAPAVVTGVSAATVSMAPEGGTNTITVAGTDLPEGLTVSAFEGAYTTGITGTTTGSGDSGTAVLTFPANTTATDKVYTLKVSKTGSSPWEDAYTTVTVRAAAITGVSPATASMTPAGGSNIITVSGTELPAGLTVKAFDGLMPTTITGLTTGSGASGTVALAFPANTTAINKTYTVKVSRDGFVWETLPTATVTVRATTFTSISPAAASMAPAGGANVIMVAGSDLPAGLTVMAFDGNTETSITGITTGSGASGTVTLTFPANASDTDKVYTLKVSKTGTAPWEAPTATVTVRAVSFANISAATTSIAPAGGTNAITVNGSDLPARLTVTAFDGNAETTITGITTGNGATGTVTLTFPANASDTDKVYTLKVSKTGSAPWEAPTATVTVRAVSFASISAATTSIAPAGGTSAITVNGADLPAGLTVTAFDGNTETAITGITAGVGASGTVTLTFPANTSAADKVYTLKVSKNGAAPWETPTAQVTVRAKAITGISPAEASMAAAGGANKITVNGTDLPAGLTIAVYDGATATAITGVTAGSGTMGTVTLNFPANTTASDKVYTLKVSKNGGTTWEAQMATVTVKAPPPPAPPASPANQQPALAVALPATVLSAGGTAKVELKPTISNGSGNYTYVWYKNGTPMAAERGFALTLTQSTKTADYFVVVTDATTGQTATSNSCSVSWAQKPAGTYTFEQVIAQGAPQVELQVAKEIMDALLTSPEKALLNSGDANIKLRLDIGAIEAPTAQEAAAVSDFIGTRDVAVYYLDMTLTKIVTDGGGRTSETAITTLAQPMRFTITIPDAMAGNAAFVIMRVHDGVTQLLTDLDTDAKTFTGETDKFSTYVLLGGPSEESITGANEASTPEEPTTPTDGENGKSLCWLWLLLIALIIVAICVWLYFKNRSRRLKQSKK